MPRHPVSPDTSSSEDDEMAVTIRNGVDMAAEHAHDVQNNGHDQDGDIEGYSREGGLITSQSPDEQPALKESEAVELQQKEAANITGGELGKTRAKTEAKTAMKELDWPSLLDGLDVDSRQKKYVIGTKI